MQIAEIACTTLLMQYGTSLTSLYDTTSNKKEKLVPTQTKINEVMVDKLYFISQFFQEVSSKYQSKIAIFPSMEPLDQEET